MPVVNIGLLTKKVVSMFKHLEHRHHTTIC
jgi:hypothetical protein